MNRTSESLESNKRISLSLLYVKHIQTKSYQHVIKSLHDRFVRANDFVDPSSTAYTHLKFATRPRQTTALSAAEWEAALLPGDLE